MNAISHRCFHCGEPIAPGVIISARLSPPQPVCCHGCAAVAELIAGAGLADYYQHRQQPGNKPDADAQRFAPYGQAQIAADFVQHQQAQSTVHVLIGGLRCAACVWLIERQLQSLPGMVEVRVNAVTQRARIRWQSNQMGLDQVLLHIARLGYEPTPLASCALSGEAGKSERAHRHHEQRQWLKRLGVSALGMMQVMMYVLPLYTREQTQMDSSVAQLLSLISLLITTPMLLYAGGPFLRSALRAVQAHHINMDVPVALALLLAYVASVYNLFVASGSSDGSTYGPTYFDSITMFIFLLTLGRYLELRVRHASIDNVDALACLQPVVAHRRVVHADEAMAGPVWQDVPVHQLAVGDELLIRVGEVMPVDALVHDGISTVDESLLTGEAKPITKQAGAPVYAGTINVAAPLIVRVSALREATLLSHLMRLLQQAQFDKPRLVQQADRIAQRFLVWLLTLTAVVAVAWWWFAPARIIDAVLAVLVVTCPCALSLATPMVIAAAISALSRQGVLVTRADAIERLANVDAVWFDKTGTLTEGHMSVRGTQLFTELSARQALQTAAALEVGAVHPIADALRAACKQRHVSNDLPVEQSQVFAGAGVQGVIAGKTFRLGHAEFVAQLRAEHDTDPGIVLGDAQHKLAVFHCRDELRSDARATLRQLQTLGVAVALYSGDAEHAVAEVAIELGIDHAYARQRPEHKLAALQTSAQRIVMVGDGINDAPVLAAAQVSVAMAQGAALAQANADILLMNDRLIGLPQAMIMARRALKIMKQNLWWAAAYNILAIPLAAMGLIAPWLAALGMSLSSLLVTLNAARLLRDAPPVPADRSPRIHEAQPTSASAPLGSTA